MGLNLNSCNVVGRVVNPGTLTIILTNKKQMCVVHFLMRHTATIKISLDLAVNNWLN